MIVFLPRDKLPKLLSNLSEMLEVVAPVRLGGESVFVTWKGQPIDLEMNPQISPIEFLLPQKEVLFKYIQQSGRYIFKEVEHMKKIAAAIRLRPQKARRRPCCRYDSSGVRKRPCRANGDWQSAVRRRYSVGFSHSCKGLRVREASADPHRRAGRR